jgi:hypothetical protein
MNDPGGLKFSGRLGDAHASDAQHVGDHTYCSFDPDS